MERAKPKAGLILTGGGARAAYQVGVLKAVRDLLPDQAKNPFPILCGTSAGAINAAVLAIYADDFRRGVGYLLEVWENFHVKHVYHADPWSMLMTSARWFASMLWIKRNSPASLFDNAPIRETLEKTLDFARIQENIDKGALYAVSVTASGYSSGENVSFYQGGPGLEAWERTQRLGAATTLDVDHLMASSALPFLFPAVKLNREYFGDGSIRQIAPISPALHLGADRVLVIGTGRAQTEAARVRSSLYPSIAQIAGHALNSIFLDGLAVDLERLQRINRTVSLIPEDKRLEAGVHLQAGQGAGDLAERVDRAHRRPARAGTAANAEIRARRHRRDEPQRLQPGELSAVRGDLLPRSHRSGLSRYFRPARRGGGVPGRRPMNLD